MDYAVQITLYIPLCTNTMDVDIHTNTMDIDTAMRKGFGDAKVYEVEEEFDDDEYAIVFSISVTAKADRNPDIFIFLGSRAT